MNGLIQDVRYALRQLRKSPGFTTVAVITLALGIGANTAIFSLVNSIMLRMLPVKDPQSLVQLNWVSSGVAAFHGSYNFGGCLDWKAFDNTGCTFSYPIFERMKTQDDVFSGVFAFAPVGLTVNFGGHTSRVQALLVSGDFFSTLGSHPALGRVLLPTDDTDSAFPAVVVSYRFWQTVLGADSTVVGRPILVNKTAATIVGVASPGFVDLDPGATMDFWLPLSVQPVVAPYLPKRTTSHPWLGLIARLKTGVSISQAQAAASTIFAVETTTGPEPVFKPGIVPRIELPVAAHGLATLQQEFGRPLSILFSAVAVVLLLACANLAGLTLARSTARRNEVAMRAALGASRFRIIRQLLTENILLCIAGGSGGIILGYWGAEALVAFLSLNWYQPFRLDVHPDWRVFGFTLLASVLVGGLSGLAGASAGARLELVSALKEIDGKSGGGSRRAWLTPGNALVISQIALAMVVMAGAGLLVRTLANLKSVNAGFDPQNLVIFGVDTTFSSRTGENLKSLGLDLQEQLAAVPGVVSVSYSSFPPVSGSSMDNTLESIGQAKSLQENVSFLPVAPDFFGTMRIPLLGGRTLNTLDVRNQEPTNSYAVAVVNESFARHYFGKQDPVGQHFRLEGEKSETEIVGVVGDAKYDHLRYDVRPIVYVPIDYVAAMNFVGEFEVRTALDPKAMMPGIRAAVSRFDSNLLINDMKTETEQIDHNIYVERLFANLSSLFALLALMLACVGIYGLLSYQVTRRTHEIGVRLALGAERADVLRLVLRQGAVLAIVGALIGGAAALAVTRYLESFLFGVKSSDPFTMAAVAALLIAIALMASFIPARRAMRVDPMVALRYE
ncbi:Efflux ABC transporter, macrolide exporter (MacB) family, permease protein [Candidatus Sulfotelmatobacter kueseliae]|uniref:Efflux ABC transporter, macrolide exporter (MacB) family, permease protein n=1 Tax=Candidatus Sulfotelmatobacter kueseliae TaxID=2042962 RepID=A0A2U3KQB3_9BACT|nr:Efflux ABC transporter, macrolide exporter (MacB) family, permease protein [Candidatus Sulfotelmatobacter kueseliae]